MGLVVPTIKLETVVAEVFVVDAGFAARTVVVVAELA
ncbi:hypothetical protein JCM5805K_0872 [Lactococcus lactis subsp. lactis]|uniref:Uncharacterized protein n=1 Tax=Lactococcus lactis subsp. lactis TaxID=1360 RepID=A0A0B8R0G6_LACLL|nr:hypothetical protein JCM5805K_0872 [Lactococcus lactis subsp. lactis]